MTATTETPLVQVCELTQSEYRADPHLATHSRVRKLLPPSTPAHAKWALDHPSTSDALDFGRAAHRAVLGAGDAYQVITGTGADPNAWRTTADKTAVAEARQAGLTPVTPAQAQQIEAMAAQLRAHPTCAALLAPESGRPEQTILWPDEQIPAVQRGVMIDWLPEPREGRRLIVTDYKTSADPHPTEWGRSAAKYGYASQAAWIVDGILAAYPGLGEDDVAVVFIAQSKVAPFPPAVIELGPDSIRVGRGLNRYAIQLWHRCWETGVWPGYGDDVHQIDLPRWFLDQWRAIS